MLGSSMNEKDWEKAIEIVEKDYGNKVTRGSAQWWSLVLGVYKRMQGRKMLRRLKQAGILRKSLDLINLLAPILTPQFPISIEQLLFDLPAPFTISPLHEALSPHYQMLIPQAFVTPPSQDPPLVFIPLTGEETVRLGHGETLPLATVEEFPQWVNTFHRAWYLAILCGILDGVFVPRGEAGLKWVIQLTSNPVLQAYLRNNLSQSIKELEEEFAKYRDVTLADALRCQHRFGCFHLKSPMMGVFLRPASIGRVWCVRQHCLSNPLFPRTATPTNLYRWWLNLIQSLMPCQYLNDGDEHGWQPVIGGTLSEDDVGALVVFSGFGIISPTLRTIEIDFDTPYSLLREVAAKVIKKRS